MAYPYVCDPCLDNENQPYELHDCQEWAGKGFGYHFCICECRGRFALEWTAEVRSQSHRERRQRAAQPEV